MVNIPAKRVEDLLQKLLFLLKQYPEGLAASDALKRLAEAVTLTQYEEGVYEGRGRRFETIVRFATVDFSGAGWLIKNDGHWTISSEGIQALKDFPDAGELRKKARLLNKQWKKAQKGMLSTSPAALDETILPEQPVSEEDEIEEALNSPRVFYDQTLEQAQKGISDYLGNMPPYEFQKLIANLLQAMGYHILWDADTPGPDGGVDILAYSDPLGIQEPRIKVQVKRQKSPVSMPELKSFIANIGPRDAGIFVCTGGFTGEAERCARTLESKQITTINQSKLIRLWIEHSSKLGDRERLRLPIAPIYFLYPPE